MTASPVPQPDHADTAPALHTETNNIIRARLYAQDVANALLVAYWIDGEGRKDFQMNNATDALGRLAAALGYRLVKEGAK